MQQGTLGHEPLEDLLLQHVVGGLLDVLLLQLLHHDALGLFELVLGDCFVVDDRHHAVETGDARRRSRSARCTERRRRRRFLRRDRGCRQRENRENQSANQHVQNLGKYSAAAAAGTVGSLTV